MDLPDNISVRYSSAFDVPASTLLLPGSASLSDVRLAILKQERSDVTSTFVDLITLNGLTLEPTDRDEVMARL